MVTKAELEVRIKELEDEIIQLRDEHEKLAIDSWLFQTLLAHIPDFVYFKDRESRFITSSAAQVKAFGLQGLEEIVGKTDFDFFTEEHARPAYEDEQRIIRTGEPIALEERETWPDGSVTWVLTTKMPIFRDGEIVGTFGLSKSITDRKKAEEEIRLLNATLEERIQERTAELEREMAERQKAEQKHARLQEEIINAQKQAIQELSTPIIPIVEQIIVIPLIGSIDTSRAQDIMRSLLAGITQHRAKVVILDITGVPIVDTGVANHLDKAIQAARLKGTHTIITGISDAVAETVVDLGINWSGIETLRDLEAGLLAALERLNIRFTSSR